MATKYTTPMKPMLNIVNKFFLLGVVLTMLAGACKLNEKDDLEPMRLFSPGDIASSSGETDVKLSWRPSLFVTPEQGVQYLVQIAKDTEFTTLEHSVTTAKPEVVITDEHLAVRQNYYARVRAVGDVEALNSKWVISNSFSIRGEQIFVPVLATEIQATSVTLRWKTTAGVSKLILKAAGSTDGLEIALTSEDNNADANNRRGFKVVEGLQPNTTYNAEIFSGNISKGTTTFITKEVSKFSTTVSTSEQLIDAIASAPNNSIIGLEAGVYTLTTNTIILQKTLTLESLSGTPNDTKVEFKEFTLKGTGAGLILKGIEFIGSEERNSLYFINLVGLDSDAQDATFTNILVDNCIIRNTINSVIRGNRGAANGHKIEDVIFTNTMVLDNKGSGWTTFTIDKLEFKKFELLNSTFHNLGRAFISFGTAMTITSNPKITIKGCTIHNFGNEGRNQILFDANANPVDLVIQNNIIANTPQPGGSVGASLFRASAANTTITFTHNNLFNVTNGANPAVALTTPSNANPANNRDINLGWSATTRDFRLPAGSELRTAGTGGVPMGDPRWAF